MANTTNIDLVKPAGTDHALVSVLNANSDKIDAEAGNVRSNFALVQNTNTATQAISKDQLVVWKGVLKKATSNIANGATLSNSNLTDTKVSTELASLSDHIANIENIESVTGVTAGTNIQLGTNFIVRHIGNIVLVYINIKTLASIPANQPILKGMPAHLNNYCFGCSGNDGKAYRFRVMSMNEDSENIVDCEEILPSGIWLAGFVAYTHAFY